MKLVIFALFIITASVVFADTGSLMPVADTFTRISGVGGGNGKIDHVTNFEGLDKLDIGALTGTCGVPPPDTGICGDTQRIAWLKFNISALNHNKIIVNSANINLTQGSFRDAPVEIYVSSDDNWEAETITWVRQPAGFFGDKDLFWIANSPSVNSVSVNITNLSIMESLLNDNGILTIVFKAPPVNLTAIKSIESGSPAILTLDFTQTNETFIYSTYDATNITVKIDSEGVNTTLCDNCNENSTSVVVYVTNLTNSCEYVSSHLDRIINRMSLVEIRSDVCNSLNSLTEFENVLFQIID